MAKDLPYLPSYKNVAELFTRISKAKIPDAFTVKYLTDTIGLKSTGDRQLISLLKKLGFLDNSGKPTSKYSLLKNSNTVREAVADGIRYAYAPLYEADENAHVLSGENLRGLIAQVSGAEEGMVKLINGTFNSLTKIADFSKAKEAADEEELQEEFPNGNNEQPPSEKGVGSRPSFNPEFRFNIEIHLPSNGTEATYLAIFSALRRSLG